jgi:hypothetical protein
MQLAKLIYESLGNNVRNTVLDPGVYKQMPIDFMYKWETSNIPRPDYLGFDKMIRAVVKLHCWKVKSIGKM